VKGLTPQKFYADHVPFDVKDHVCLIHAPTSDKPYHKLFTVRHLGNVVGGHEIRYVNVPMEEFKKFASEQIQKGDAVWFGCDVGKHFHRKDFVLDMDLFDYGASLGTNLDMTKAQRLNYRNSKMTHAMVLTAVDVQDGKPRKWRVENSWGEKGQPGNKGYIVMSDNWFEQ